MSARSPTKTTSSHVEATATLALGAPRSRPRRAYQRFVERQEIEPVVNDVELSAPSNTEATCRHSATLASIVASSDQPHGAAACRLAAVIESAVAKTA